MSEFSRNGSLLTARILRTSPLRSSTKFTLTRYSEIQLGETLTEHVHEHIVAADTLSIKIRQ
jgi:hypothetical protein